MAGPEARWFSGAGAARFARFLVVGAVNTAFGYGIYALALFATGHPVVASTISFAAGIAFSFKTHRHFVFPSGGSQAKAFRRYVLAWLAIYVMNVSSLALLVRAGMNAYIAGAALILPISVPAFVLMRFLVFPSVDKPA